MLNTSHACAALLAAALILSVPATAGATVTTTAITAPTGTAIGPVTVDPNLGFPPVAVAGTSDGTTGDKVDIVCAYTSEAGVKSFKTLAAGVAVGAGGGFSATVDGQKMAIVPCRLTAVPAGTAQSAALASFHGVAAPVVVDEPSKPATGPNAGKTYDYYAAGSSTHGYADFNAMASCGIDDARVFTDPDADGRQTQSQFTFYCNGYYPPNVGDPSNGYRASVRVDGHDAFFSGSAHSILPDGAWPGLTETVTHDAARDTTTIVERDALSRCPSNVTAALTNNTNCSAFSATGVSVERTMVIDRHGLVITQSDRWSTTGAAKQIDLLDEQDFATSGGGNGYRFPGQAAVATHTAGDVVAIPAGNGPASILNVFDTSGAANAANPVASTSLWPLPDQAVFINAFQYRLHHAFTIPADGSFTISKVYAQQVTGSDLAALTAEAEDRLVAPTIAITAPADGTSTSYPTVQVTGTVADNVGASVAINGLRVPVTGGTFSFGVTLTPGANTITAVATDAAGNTATATRTVIRTIPSTFPGGGIPGTPAPGNTPPVIATIGRPKVTRAVARVRVDAGMRVTCPATGSACAVSGVLQTARPIGTPSRRRTLARRSLELKPGTRATIRFTLSRDGARLLRRLGKLPVVVAISARAGTGAPVQQKRRFVARAPRPR